MSIYDLQELGRGIYGTGYGKAANRSIYGGLRSARNLQEEEPPPDESSVLEMEPLEDSDPSLLRQAADVSLGGLSMVGNVLDLPVSIGRDLLTWLPGGTKPVNPLDQLLSPFSDKNRTKFSDLAKDYGMVSRDMNPVGEFALDTSLDILLDPVTYLSFGASAVGKGGKILRNAGLAADASKVASRRAGGLAIGNRVARQTVTPRQVVKELDVRSLNPDRQSELLDAIRSRSPDKTIDKLDDLSIDDIPDDLLDSVIGGTGQGTQRFVDAYNASLPKGMQRAEKLGDIPAEYLDDAIGGNWRFRIPGLMHDPVIINDLPLPGGFGDGAKIAEFGDKAAEAIRYSAPVRYLASVFSTAMLGTKNATVQRDMADISRRAAESSQVARDQAVRLLEDIDNGQFFPKGDLPAARAASDAMLNYLELGTELPENLAPLQSRLDEMKQGFKDALAFQQEHGSAVEELGGLKINKKVYDEAGELVGESEIPSPIDYFHRDRVIDAGPLWRASRKRPRMDTLDPAGIARQDKFRHLSTSKIQQMSTDLEFAGIADKGVMGRGRRRSLKDWFHGRPDTGVMGSTPVEEAMDMKEMFARFTAKYDPFELIDPAHLRMDENFIQANMPGIRDELADAITAATGSPVADDVLDAAYGDVRQIDQIIRSTADPKVAKKLQKIRDRLTDKEVESAIMQRHRQVFDSIVGLNRAQAEKGLPMFAINPAESYLHRLDSAYTNATINQGAREITAKNSRVRFDSPYANKSAEAAAPAGRATDRFNLLDHMNKLGMNHGRAKARMLAELGDEAKRIYDDIELQLMTQAEDDLYEGIAKALGEDNFERELFDEILDFPDNVEAVIEGVTDEATKAKLFDKFSAVYGAKRQQVNPDDVLKQFDIDSEVAADLERINRTFSQPEEVSVAVAALDAGTNLFKGLVTALWPAFHSRNYMSGSIQNFLNGVFDPRFGAQNPQKFLQPQLDAYKLATGKTIDDASEIPQFARQLDEYRAEFKRKLDRGEVDPKTTPDELWKIEKTIDATGQEIQRFKNANEWATQQVRRQMFSRKLVDSPGDHNDIVGNMGGRVVDRMVGRRSFKERVAPPDPDNTTALGRAFKFWDTPGVGGTQNNFAPMRYGRAVGDISEQIVRGSAYIAFLRQGVDPAEAARRVNRLQVDYSNLTDVERNVFRRAAPFYSFTKGATSYLASELAQRPGGPIGATIKAAENASGDDPGAPAHVRAGFNVPLSTAEDGTRTYLVGAGLMHEPPLQLVGPTISGTLFNAASMLHPAAKLPIELMTNESLFQEGPDGGGRSLDDMDPPLGRTLSNVTNAVGLTDREAPFRLFGDSKVPEAVIANSPVARVLSEVRKMTDPRKSVMEKAVGSLTGMKLTTIEPEDQDAVLREQVEQLMRDMGGRNFAHAYLPDSVLATLEGEDLERAKRLQALMKELNNRQRKRKKEREDKIAEAEEAATE